MDRELSPSCAILDHNHVLILLNIEKDLSGVAEAAPAVMIILMTVTQFPTNVKITLNNFSRENNFNTLTSSSKLMDSHSKIVGVVEVIK